MNLSISTEIVKARGDIQTKFQEMFDKEFSGLAPGTTYLHDPEFLRWFESERDGVPGPPQTDPATGQQVPGWKKPPRPDLEQLLALSGTEGHDILMRYARITGREEVMKAYIMVTEMQAKAKLKGATNGTLG